MRDPGAWKVTPLAHYSFLVKPPSSSNGSFVHARLEFKMRKTYPAVPPEIKVVEAPGVSTVAIEELQTMLRERARELVGDEMVFVLATVASEFLQTHNRPPEPSFYEQMLQREAEAATASSTAAASSSSSAAERAEGGMVREGGK